MDASAPVDYQSLRFDYRRHPDQDAATPARHPVVVVGAGPVGLALAIDLAQQQVPVVLLDNDCTLSTGSRAICFAKRTLEVFDRLGCGERMVAKGVSWNVGKVFFRDEQVYRFDLLPEPGHERPAFINLQQYYVEGYLAERAAELPLVDLRWNNKVVGIDNGADGVLLQIETPEGFYRLAADYVAACDGSRSNLRQLLGQEAKGRVFRDRFLIADIRMDLDRPPPGRPKAGERPLGGQRGHEVPSVGAEALNERRFWFDPPFHPHQSVLLHKQADAMWRVDFQLGWDADPVEERKHERITPRVRALLDSIGFERVQFSIGWASVYTFACQRMERFRHGRVLFAGDSAHGVSPFGARGANSGVQDADNLAWKLAAVVKRAAPDALLDSYGSEREYAADENIRNSTRATDFITPKSEVSRLFRDAVLELSKTQPFARALVNSGRLSVPSTLHGSPLNTPDVDAFEGRMVPGAPAADAPIVRADGSTGWLLRALPARFTALVFGEGEAAERSLAAIAEADRPLHVVRVTACGEGELAARRYDARPGTVYLLRPDQHVCARWRAPGAQALREAFDRALAKGTGSPS
ncbi:3-(3-hydroxy-phenyl)propionate/3-hydroxycinnamic acid hydroxylase [Variovorax sp. PBS-H4]|uniref:FAD-dependent oxidoreductase n=1 Tax=Variovorax sp. PBS-H4 TaxID=434008 RepID=UPI0013160FA2|nr:FAD-dependent oxidoreductase [Variovorax sp. PBS-H4]VTU41000.1 3-(3-hydroxy-phenyl)propionate/3-hydroxycinnamic acid hydroxylase [Variovorax sp. PBS-H4]